MGMSKKLKVVYSIYTFLAFFAANLPCVEDLVTEGTCSWICNAKGVDIDAKELDRKIFEGDIVRLKIIYEERVVQSCANEMLNANNKTEVGLIWFKKMPPTSMRAIEFLSGTFVENWGGTLFKSSKDMTVNVTCISNSVTKNHSTRFAFHTPQSVMYFVKQAANYSKKEDKFLTFIRRENNIRITVNVTSLETNISQANALDDNVNTEIIVIDIWLFVFELICAITVLYSHAILLLCRPSEVIMQLTQKKRESGGSPVETPSVHLTDRGDVVSSIVEESQQRDTQTEAGEAHYSITELQTPSNTNSEIAGLPRGTSVSTSFRKTDGKPANVSKTHIQKLSEIDSRCTWSAESRSDGAHSQPFKYSGTSCTQEIATSDNRRIEYDGIPTDVGTANTVNSNYVYMGETSDHGSTTIGEQNVSLEGDGYCISMIVVGGPFPVSIGSWIGNKLFAVTNGNQCHKFKKTVKFIVISLFPQVLLVGSLDLLLLLLKIQPQVTSDLPSSSLTSSVFKVMFNENHPGLIFLVGCLFLGYVFRCLFVYGIIDCHAISGLKTKSSTWKSCFVHSRHPLIFSRLKCLFRPCNECENSPPECPTEIEVPDNILHNFEELPGIFIKYWSFIFDSFVERLKTKKIALFFKIVLFIAVIGILCFMAFFCLSLLKVVGLIFVALLFITPIVDILLSSPLVCLCHGRMWIFKDGLLFRFVEFVLVVFSLTWVAFHSFTTAVVMETAIAAFLNLLKNHPKKLVPLVTVVALACHYVLCSYTFFTVQYFELVEELFICYRKKFDELEKEGKVDKLLSYKQGQHVKLIPRDLLKYACEHKLIKMPVGNSVGILLLKIGALLLVFLFVFLIIHAPSSDYVLTGIVITFLIIAYKNFNDYINGTPKSLFKEDVNIVVNDYIKKQQ